MNFTFDCLPVLAAQGLSEETWVFIITSLLKIGVVIGVVLGMVSYTVVAERRFSAAIQDRVGPNRVGIPLTKIKILGLGQPIADSLKLMLKEDFTPAHVNKFYYWLAPALGVAPALISLCVIPFASIKEFTLTLFNHSFVIPQPGVIANIDIGILFVFAIASLGVYGIVLAGWSANSKYPFLGGIRSSAQMISYEISMGLSVIPVFLVIGNMNLSSIIEYQADNGWLVLPFMTSNFSLSHPGTLLSWVLLPLMGVSFIIFLVSTFAETNRAPFDLPESETELVGGYNTEYSSMKFALFFLGEYAAMIVGSAMIVTLFFGGWTLPLGAIESVARVVGVTIDPQILNWLVGVDHPWWFIGVHALVFLAKVAFFIFFFIWVRWTVPRFRYDQLMHLGWKIFLPVALANVLLTGLVLALFKSFGHKF